ncbi:MAG: BTAD domain-containing putative transcriptional regulator, partial [Vicinamibacterales bacterium]
KTLTGCMDGLPVDVIRADPWLLYLRGHAVATLMPDEAAECLEAAYDMFRARQDVAGEFSAALATMETMMIKSASYEPWDRWIEALGRSLELHSPEDPELAVRAWYTLVYTSLYRQPGHRLIRPAIAFLARELFGGRLRATQALQAATGLLAYAHFSCDAPLAERVIPVMRSLLEDENVAVMSRSIGSAWMTVYSYFDARYRESLCAADAAIQLAQHHGLDAIARAQFWYRVQSLAHLGKKDDALALVASLNLPEHLSPNSFVGAYSATSSALVYFVAGDVATAIRLGQQGLDAWKQNGFITARLGWAQSMQSIYLMAADDIDEALRLVDEAESLLSGTECTYPFALHRALHAYASLIRGDKRGAVDQLQLCFALADNHKRLAILSWAKPFLPRLFALAQEEGIARETVAELISEWDLAPPTPDEPHWPRPIEVRMLGGFEVRTHGELVSFGRKPPRKALALLKAVAMSGDRGISVETARNWFWPDSDGDAAVGSQGAALYRLRKILGSAYAVRLEEGRLWLDPSLVWVDVTAFLRLAASDREDDGFRALSLYRGQLLPHDEDAPWAIATRLQLRDAFGRLVDRLGGPLESMDPDAAAALYLRGIETEPLSEASYRGLMRCHAIRGHNSDAAAVYRRLRQTLSVVLGIGPSAASDDLHRKILGNRSP